MSPRKEQYSRQMSKTLKRLVSSYTDRTSSHRDGYLIWGPDKVYLHQQGCG